MKRLLLLLMFFVSSFKLNAQFHIGGDFGAISYDLSDEYIGPHQYDDLTSSFFNPSLFYLGESNLFFARFGKKVTRLDLAEDEGYQATNFLEIENYELSAEYFRKVVSFTPKLDGFIGISQSGHFTFYNREFRSAFYGSDTKSHEMGAVVLTLNTLLDYQTAENSFHYKAGVSVLSMGSRPESRSNDIELRLFSWSEYVQIQQSLTGYLKISDRFLLKPEYQLRYYTFKDPQRFKMLRQSFFVGVFIRI